MKISANEELIEIELPEGFIASDFQNDPNGWTAEDKARNIVINIGWKTIPFLEKKTLLEKTLKNTIKKFKTRVLGFVERKNIEMQISDEHACGCRYSYVTADGKKMSEFLIVKHNKQYLVFVFICAEEEFYDYYEIFENFLKKVKLS